MGETQCFRCREFYDKRSGSFHICSRIPLTDADIAAKDAEIARLQAELADARAHAGRNNNISDAEIARLREALEWSGQLVLGYCSAHRDEFWEEMYRRELTAGPVPAPVYGVEDQGGAWTWNRQALAGDTAGEEESGGREIQVPQKR